MKFAALILSVLLASSVASSASTTVYYSDFSSTSGANSIDSWVYGGTVGGSVARYSGSFDNFDTSAPIGDGSGPYGGDGVKGDGAIRFNTGDEVINNEIWTYTLSVVLTEGDMLSLSGAAFNANASNNSGFSVSLYNATDSRILVSSGNLGGTTTGLVAADINPFYEFNVSYTVVAADLTDTIEIRVFESLNNSSRDGFLDFVRVGFQAVPEPSRSFLALLGFTSLALRRRRPSDDRLLV